MKYINEKEFELSGILNWHNLGYTGKDVKIANMETCNVDAWYFKKQVNDPLIMAEKGKRILMESNIKCNSSSCSRCEFYTLPWGGSYSSKSVTATLQKIFAIHDLKAYT